MALVVCLQHLFDDQFGTTFVWFSNSEYLLTFQWTCELPTKANMACPSCRGSALRVRSSDSMITFSKGGPSKRVPFWVQICLRFLPAVVPDHRRHLLLLFSAVQTKVDWLILYYYAVTQTPWPSSSSCRSRSNSSRSKWCQWWRALAAQAPGALACVTAAATWAPVSHSFFFAFGMECLLKLWRGCTHCIVVIGLLSESLSGIQ